MTPARRYARPVRSCLPPQLLEHDRIDALDPLNALLEVLVPGPVEERVGELAFVAELCESFSELCGQIGVDLEPVLGRRLAEDRPVQAVDPAQLVQRAGMLVHPYVDDLVGEPRVAAAALDDEQCRRLLSAAVVAGCLDGVAAVEEARRERARAGLESLRDRVHGGLGDQNVPLRRVALADSAAGPLEALGAAIRRRPAFAVDDPNLPVVATVVGGCEALDDLLCAQPFA